MAFNISLDSFFTWGDPVIIKTDAPAQFRPGSIGSICGIRIIDSESIAHKFDQKINSELYLVEFADGKSMEISMKYLSHYDHKS